MNVYGSDILFLSMIDTKIRLGWYFIKVGKRWNVLTMVARGLVQLSVQFVYYDVMTVCLT